MRAIDQKVIRDLWHLRGQVLAIAMVLASGVAVLVMALSTQNSLLRTANAYYEQQLFGDVFAGVKRAPDSLARRIADIEGVKLVQTRIISYATLDIEGFAEPVIGQLVSIPERREPRLNRLVLLSGRTVEPNRPNEVVLNQPFAEAHSLRAGSTFKAILNGHRRELKVVGIALSPEVVYSLGPGALMPDDQRFGVMWMGQEALAAAFDLKEAFNSVSLSIDNSASAERVISHLDRLLERYGGIRAIARKDHISNWFVMNEIDQLGTMAKILPGIFLLVSAFLTNMVLARLVSTERSQIGLMKAFGYSNTEVGWHYVKLVLVIAVLGIALGIGAGMFFGYQYTELYATLFRFPILHYNPSSEAIVLASGVSLFAALLGVVSIVRRAAGLPPAQAMVPPAPPSYSQGRFSTTRLANWIDQPTRIIARHVIREPVRSSLTAFGIASATAVLVLAFQWNDAINHLAESYFYNAQRQDLMVGLTETESSTVLHEFEHMPGVLSVEPMRIVSADLHFGNLSHRGSISAVTENAFLQPVYDDKTRATVAVPENGLVIASRLAQKLKVKVGDRVRVEVHSGRRPTVELPVISVFETYLGMPAFARIESLNRLLLERASVEYVSLLVDPLQQDKLFAHLKSIPSVSAVMIRQAAIDSFYETLANNLMVFITIFTGFACALAFGVAYNASRISLSERGRELATLRVLGFTRGEISYILLGEIALLILIGLPVGCLLGVGLAQLMANAFDTELFRIPMVIRPSSFGLAVVITLIASMSSALVVRRRLARLDLVEVLKTRE